MANTAPTATGDSGAPRRGLWQAPLFVAGLAALIAVAEARPTIPCVAGDQHGDLVEARRLLERRDGDLARCARLAEHVLEQADAAPAVAGEAQFLLGSCLLRQAERGESAENWAAARLHLEVADHLGVADADAPFLQLRLGKVLFQSGGDPRAVVARVRPAAERLPRDGQDLIDAYVLLTNAYRRLPSDDDLREALAYNKKLRDLKQAKEDVLSLARLIGGEIQLRLKDPEGARRSLERVGPEASLEVQAEARLLVARSHEEEGHWPEAAALWQKALADAKKPAVVLYHLGVCAANDHRPADAIHHWEQCVQVGAGGNEAQAAALALAELRLKGDAPDTALDMLTLAVADVKGPDDWHNLLMDLAAVRTLFGDAAQAYAKAGNHELVLKLADPFAKVAERGQVASLKATAAAAWGRQRLEQAKLAAPETRKDEEAAGRDLLRQAAAANEEASKAAPATADQAEYLWQSAAASREAGDVAPTAEKLDRYLRLESLSDERKSEGWYWLGEARRLMKELDAADLAYIEAMKYQTKDQARFAMLARYQWAVAQAAKGNIDQAAAALQMNLDKLSINSDPEVKEKSLYALGDLEFRRGKYYGEVVRRLGEAVECFKDNPSHTRARFQLATAYRRLADQTSLKSPLGDDVKDPAAREAKLAEHKRYLGYAADGFLSLAHFLQSEDAKGHLTLEEEVQVPFLAAECLFDHGDYNLALEVYEHLYGRFPGRPEGLDALGGMVRCHGVLEDKTEAKRRLDEIEELLKTMSKETLPATARQQWTKWVADVRKAPGMAATP